MINATLSLLKDGFSKRYESGNSQHEELKKIMDSIAEGAGALEIMAANPDPEQSLESHDLKLGRAGKKLQEALDAAKEKFDKVTTNVAVSFDVGLKEHSGLKYGPFASEIRGMVRPLGPGERVRWVQDRILAADGESLSSLLLPPAYLSGLTEEERAKFTLQYFTVSVPKIVAAQELYNDLADFVQAVFKTAQRAITRIGQPSKYNKAEEQQQVSLNAERRLKATVGGSL